MNKNRDYTRYSKEPIEVKESVVIEESANSVETVIEGEPIVEDVKSVENVETVQEPEVEESEPVIGVVTDCTRLNVREFPLSDSMVLGVITAETELVIIEEESTEDFYKICTSAGLEGYCMKRYVTIMP